MYCLVLYTTCIMYFNFILPLDFSEDFFVSFFIRTNKYKCALYNVYIIHSKTSALLIN